MVILGLLFFRASPTVNLMRRYPEVESFSDYRLFMRSRIAELREGGRTYRDMADAAGFASKGFLKHVADGERHLSIQAAPRVAAALELGPRETRVFVNLVRLVRETSDEARLEAWRGVMREHKSASARLQRDQFEAYTRWYPFVLRELAGMPGFRENYSWLARRLRPKISQSMARAGMRLLERVGLLERDAAGELRQATVSLETGPIVKSLAVRTYHRAMLELASKALEQLPKQERNVTSLMLPMTRDEYDEVTAKVRAFRKELLTWWEQRRAEAVEPDDQADEAADQEVFQMMVTVVPCTQPVKS